MTRNRLQEVTKATIRQRRQDKLNAKRAADRAELRAMRQEALVVCETDHEVEAVNAMFDRAEARRNQ